MRLTCGRSCGTLPESESNLGFSERLLSISALLQSPSTALRFCESANVAIVLEHPRINMARHVADYLVTNGAFGEVGDEGVAVIVKPSCDLRPGPRVLPRSP
jgi:hypothetical protein